MRGAVVRWLAEGRPARGPFETGLIEVLHRHVRFVRVGLVVVSTVLGVLGSSAPHRLLAVAVGVVVGVCCVIDLGTVGRRADSALPAAVAVLVVGLVSSTVDGPGGPGGSGWVFAVASITAICAQFEFATRPASAWGLSLLAALAVAAGARTGDGPVPVVGRMLFETVLAFVALLLLRRWARDTDRSRASAAERRRAEQIAAARWHDERAYGATLHDTACTTLLAVALGVRDTRHPWLRERAGDDLARLTTPSPVDTPQVDLAVLLPQACAHPDLRVSWQIPAQATVPTAVGLAVFHGVREAVQNVVSHAGVDTATLHVTRPPGGLRVALHDTGRGFDPAGVARHRHGITGSIIGRMAAAGGRAEIDSAPATGTTVRWHWDG